MWSCSLRTGLFWNVLWRKCKGNCIHIKDEVLTGKREEGKFWASFQMLLTELNREPGANPGRARRCNRGRTLHKATANMREGAAGRMIRESEDLSGKRETCRIEGYVRPGEPSFFSYYFRDIFFLWWKGGRRKKEFIRGKSGHPRINTLLVRGFFLPASPSPLYNSRRICYDCKRTGLL